MPEPLWKAAAALAREHGVSRTAQALNLDYYSLKRRMEASAPMPTPAIAGAPGGGFIEIPLKATPSGPACVVEVEDGRGARLHMELRGLCAGDVASVVRSVWSGSR